MPDYFSHDLTAEIIYEKLDFKYRSAITSKTLYLLGAQGGDLFFAYSMKPSKSNLGRYMHGLDAQYLFERLIEGNRSYVAGFATHYALDCTLHPQVYAYEQTKRSPIAHTRFENDLGLFISRKYGMRRKIIPREKLLECTGPVYDTVKRIEPLITVTGVERCLKRHFLWTKYIYKSKRNGYKCDYDFNSLSPQIESSVEFGIKAVESVLDRDIDAEIFNRHFLQK